MGVLNRKKTQISKKNAEEAITDVHLTLVEEIKRTRKGCLTALIIFSRNWTHVQKQLIK